MSYRGDFYLGSNVDFKFTSIDAGIPTSVSGSFVAIYGSNSVSEITAGITFTPDFDSRVGLNHVRVAATVGNGFAAATDYDVVMISGTVGGKSIAGYILGSFSLQNRYNDITGTYPFANLTNLDAPVSSIKSKTDQLTFTNTNQVDANIQAVNDTDLIGDGSATPWGPA